MRQAGLLFLAALAAGHACGRDVAAPMSPVSPTSRPTGLSEQAADAILVGAGDIALCGSAGGEATARLLDRLPGSVFTLGDHAYPSGTDQNYRECYEPTWGRHRWRTRPSPGNHDYDSAEPTPPVTTHANSESRADVYGVLRLVLQSNGYPWSFLSGSGAVIDSGSGLCHDVSIAPRIGL